MALRRTLQIITHWQSPAATEHLGSCHYKQLTCYVLLVRQMSLSRVVICACMVRAIDHLRGQRVCGAWISLMPLQIGKCQAAILMQLYPWSFALYTSHHVLGYPCNLAYGATGHSQCMRGSMPPPGEVGHRVGRAVLCCSAFIPSTCHNLY